jgi:transketolase
MEAYNKLVSENIHPMLVSVPMLQPLNHEALFETLKDMRHVVSVEEHYENSGLGNILTGLCSKHKPSWQLKTMGIPYGFIHEVKDQQGMRELFGISSENIVKTVKGLLEN